MSVVALGPGVLDPDQLARTLGLLGALAPLRQLARHPAAVALRRRYVRPLGFLAARLNPATALGLILTVQLVVLVALGAAWLAAVLAATRLLSS